MTFLIEFTRKWFNMQQIISYIKQLPGTSISSSQKNRYNRYSIMGSIHLFTLVSAVLFAQITAKVSTEVRRPLLTPEEGCGISKIANSKIVGGTEAKIGQYPWMALFGYKNSSGGIDFKCGGSLITSRHILTAGHCIFPRLTFVRLGEHTISTTSDGEHQDIKIIRKETHPNFTLLPTNDIAILTLERDVEFNDHIRPICLPLSEEIQKKSFVGDNPFVAGWGFLKEDGPSSDVLMHVQTPVIDNAKCGAQYDKFEYLGIQITDSKMCAGYESGDVDACNGDSGGPLMLPVHENGQFPMYQIGVISTGAGCARANAPGVYTRVSYFMDWINEKVNIK